MVLWRGFSIQEACNQIFGNAYGSCKGRQMPIVILIRRNNNLLYVKKFKYKLALWIEKTKFCYNIKYDSYASNLEIIIIKIKNFEATF